MKHSEATHAAAAKTIREHFSQIVSSYGASDLNEYALADKLLSDGIVWACSDCDKLRSALKDALEAIDLDCACEHDFECFRCTALETGRIILKDGAS